MTPTLGSPLTSLTPLLWLVLVLVSIPVALWLLRRSGYAGLSPRAVPGSVRVVSQSALSPQHRLVTVEVGEGAERCWLVLGMTGQQISVLHRLVPPPSEGEPARSTPALPSIAGTSFGYLLTQWRRGPQGPAVQSHEQ
ncbi:flagellar biosynthetic protein FliO [Sphaerotilus sp.]|jgi:flagellar protein FliO/FliZ|uniref:FliO/MopB family protein n=1 Tax=Sphaerotilus sp. TaxID=2093942 RepID=UPI002ACD508A|nr:flagellar biosynthetic protein FliO [Sphaerotilus sp.]MDZ7857649.1 flagellar biosynthetic protein FliO [Sphaerotilus sp.]